MKISRVDDMSIRIDVEIKRNYDNAFYILLRGDAHHDSVDCDRTLEKKHLNLIKEKKGIILDLGDLFDAMQGRADKRGNKSALREELKCANYWNKLVDETAKNYESYAENFAVLLKGNHEQSVVDKFELDITQMLAEKLQAKGSQCLSCGSVQFVHICFLDGQARHSIVFYLKHGSGGGGAVTRGVIDSARTNSIVEGVDIIARGHTHESWIVETPRLKYSHRSGVSSDNVYHINVPSYKKNYANSNSWEAGQNHNMKALGAYFIKCFFQPTTDKYDFEIQRLT